MDGSRYRLNLAQQDHVEGECDTSETKQPSLPEWTERQEACLRKQGYAGEPLTKKQAGWLIGALVDRGWTSRPDAFEWEQLVEICHEVGHKWPSSPSAETVGVLKRHGLSYSMGNAKAVWLRQHLENLETYRRFGLPTATPQQLLTVADVIDSEGGFDSEDKRREAARRGALASLYREGQPGFFNET